MMKEELLSWLLEAETPTIRYLALVDLMGLPEDDRRVQEARQAIMREGPVPAILAGQTEGGDWAGEHSFYTPKYRSTHWSLLLLAELQVDGTDPRFRRGVEFMLGETAGPLAKRLAGDESGWSCLFGNVLRYICHAGLAGSDGAVAVIDYCLREIDNGYCRCDWNSGRACAWGVARTLWGLAALPKELRARPWIGRSSRAWSSCWRRAGCPRPDYPVPDGGRCTPSGHASISRCSTRRTCSLCCASPVSWAHWTGRERRRRWPGWRGGGRGTAAGAAAAPSAGAPGLSWAGRRRRAAG